MRKLGIVVTAIACLMMAAVAFSAEAPVAGAAKGQMTIGFFGGMGMPMGELADTDHANMKTGFGGGAFFDYFVNPQIALGLDGGYVTMANQEESSFKANTMQYGLHGKYFIPTGGPVVPYLNLGLAMYGQKIEFKEDAAAMSLSGTQFGFNGGVGVDFKVNESVFVGVNGIYHMGGKFEPEVDGAKEEVLKDWNYMTLNASVTFRIPMAK